MKRSIVLCSLAYICGGGDPVLNSRCVIAFGVDVQTMKSPAWPKTEEGSLALALIIDTPVWVELIVEGRTTLVRSKSVFVCQKNNIVSFISL